MNLLIVDDDKYISNILSIALEEEGYEVSILNDSLEAKTIIETKYFDLIILDIMMPQIDGFDLCKHARCFTDAPILFITCLDDEQSLISALSLGGDDYIKKPFTLSEVIIRVKAHLRRMEKNRNIIKNQIHKTKNFIFNYGKNIIISDKNKIHLSPLESDLLNYFFEHKNTILTYKSIYESIWNEPYIRDKSTIMTRVSNLRNKVPSLEIDTVRGKGYIFVQE